jgi:glycosyltransferase involved in cell wall biosynthesis
VDKKVSVIVPCYNQGKYLEEAIDSVINQTYSNWECIIINDGSTDETEEIALKLVAKDGRINYYTKPNGGLSSTRNFGVDKSIGTYILPLDADDKIHATYIEKAVTVFQDSDVKVVYCEAERFDAGEGKFEFPEYSRSLLAYYNLIICSGLYKKEDFIDAGGYNINMKFGWEDWDFWISMLKNGGNVFRIPEILFYYRIKEKSMLSDLTSGGNQQKMQMQVYLNHSDFFDEYHSEPIHIFDKHRNLIEENKELKAHINFLKGLIKLKPSSYISLAKKIREKWL